MEGSVCLCSFIEHICYDSRLINLTDFESDWHMSKFNDQFELQTTHKTLVCMY